jgi:hypothetical protein
VGIEDTGSNEVVDEARIEEASASFHIVRTHGSEHPPRPEVECGHSQTCDLVMIKACDRYRPHSLTSLALPRANAGSIVADSRVTRITSPPFSFFAFMSTMTFADQAL